MKECLILRQSVERYWIVVVLPLDSVLTNIVEQDNDLEHEDDRS